MKIKVILAALILSSNFSFGQSKLTNLSFGLNYGIHGSMNQESNISVSSSNALTLNVKYKFKPNFGLILFVGYDAFNTKSINFSKTNYANVSIEAIYNLSSVLKLNVEKFDLNIHAGPGIATMWNSSFVDANAQDPYIKNNDDIVTLNVGINPEYNFSNKFAVNVDFSYMYNMMNDRSMNFVSKNNDRTASMYALSLGVRYKL
jgi:opacity protein-like surface antigen